MKLVILYHPNSEFSRSVEEFAHDFEYRMPDHKIDLMSLETREGTAMASLYDVVQYPAILALRDDGQILKFWQGDVLPLMSEVASYANS